MRLSEDHTSGRRFQFQKTKQVRMLVWSKTRSCFTIDDVSHIHLDHFELSPTAARQLPVHTMTEPNFVRTIQTSYEQAKTGPALCQC